MIILPGIPAVESHMITIEKPNHESIENFKPPLHLNMDFSLDNDNASLTEECLSTDTTSSMDCNMGFINNTSSVNLNTLISINNNGNSIGGLGAFARDEYCIDLEAFYKAFDLFIPLLLHPFDSDSIEAPYSSPSSSTTPLHYEFPSSCSSKTRTLQVVSQNPTASVLHNIALAKLIKKAHHRIEVHIIHALPPATSRISKRSNRMSHLYAAINDPSIIFPDENMDTVYHTNRYFANINRWRLAHPSPQLSDTDSDPWERENFADLISTGSSIMSEGDVEDDASAYISDVDVLELIQSESRMTASHWHMLQELDIPGVFNTVSEPSDTIPSVVRPASIDLSFCMQLIPVHHLEHGFMTNLETRYNELADGGIMLISQPSSCKFFTKTVLPCLDQALYHMLALNLVSSNFCEDMSSPPNSDSALPFETQKTLVERLPNVEILHMDNCIDFSFPSWSSQWLFYESEWLNSKLSYYGGRRPSTGSLDSPLHSGYQGTMIAKLLQGMSRRKAWKQPGVTDVSIFVIRKNAQQQQ